jgi:hypothetical protein
MWDLCSKPKLGVSSQRDAMRRDAARRGAARLERLRVVLVRVASALDEHLFIARLADIEPALAPIAFRVVVRWRVVLARFEHGPRSIFMPVAD